jgi:thiosulfate/3-mercaptopyruvate sulfurtransferase
MPRMTLPGAHLLIEPEALERELGNPDLRVFDCTVILEVGPEGLSIRSGRDDWARAHVPGAGFLDLLEELSDTASPYRFMLPPAAQFEAVMSAHGVGEGTRVVLYDSRDSSWAARVWWMLRAYGFDDAVLLNGGWRSWSQEGGPTTDEPPAYPPGSFRARKRQGVLVGKDAVLEGMGAGGTCLINALDPEQHRGEGGTVPGGRPGHIPGSSNVPSDSLVDAETGRYLPEAELRVRLQEAGATDAPRVITYCGGGISASSVGFALRLLGHEDVAVYDASLEEWATDPDLPIELG